MPAPLDVNREAIKTLVLAVGCTEAAKQTGIPLNTILSWSARGNWLKPAAPQLPPTVQPTAITAINPSDALANVLADNHKQTKLQLSKYTLDASKKAADSEGDLKLSRQVKDVAGIMQAVYPEQHQSNGGIHIGVLTGQVAIQYNPSQD